MKATRPEIERALAAPGDIRLFLLHGPDEGASRALARRLADALGPEAEARQRRWVDESLAALDALPDEQLSLDNRIDKQIARTQLRSWRFWLDELRTAHTDPLFYTGLIGDGLDGELGDDPDANKAAIRAAMGEALAELPAPETPVASLRQILMRLAYDADFVFDLHADNQALRHLYVGTPLWPDPYLYAIIVIK